MYRSEAVDAVAMALDDSLSNEKVQSNCCRALLILVGRFSPSGKIMTEDWILKEDGFVDGPDPNYFENEEHVLAHEIIPLVCLLFSFLSPSFVPYSSSAHIHRLELLNSSLESSFNSEDDLNYPISIVISLLSRSERKEVL